MIRHDREAAPGTQRPGGRTARTRAAVLEAVLAELTEHGFATITMEKVAARAGVAPSTVYRRWGSVAGVVRDLADELTIDFPLPETGNLEGDLRYLARGIVGLYNDPAHRGWMDGMIAAAVHDPAARETLSAVMAYRIAETSGMVQKAIDRGEVPTDTDTSEVIRMTAAALYYRMYVTGEPVDLPLADRSAAMAALAARNGLLTSS